MTPSEKEVSTLMMEVVFFSFLGGFKIPLVIFFFWLDEELIFPFIDVVDESVDVVSDPVLCDTVDFLFLTTETDFDFHDVSFFFWICSIELETF